MGGLVSPLIVFAEPQICDIKYGHIDLTSPQSISLNVGRLINNRPPCSQIGTEFNELGEKLVDKPIFACCRPFNES